MRENRTRYIVLGMLGLGPAHGYGLRQRIDASVGQFWQESWGQLYPTLRTLSEDGLIEELEDDSVETIEGASRRGRRSRTFRITGEGRKELREWLAGEVVLPVKRDELLLRTFFALNGEPEDLRQNVLRSKAWAEEKLGVASSAYEGIKGMRGQWPDAPWWLLTALHGKMALQTHIEWCNEALRLIDEEG